MTALYVLFSIATSVYCVLAYLPFTYQQMLRSDLIPAAGMFARWHPYLQVPATAVLAAALWTQLSVRRRPALLLFAFQAAAAVACLISPVLVRLTPGWQSLAAALAALLAAASLGLLRLRPQKAEPVSVSSGRLFAATVLSAGVASTVSVAAAALDGKPLSPASVAAVAVVHAAVFGGAWLVVALVLSACRAAGVPSNRTFWLLHGLLLGAIWRVTLTEICRPFGFEGAAAAVWSGLLALTLTLLSARYSPAVRLPAWAWAVALTAVSAGAAPAIVSISRFDWNHMGGHVALLVLWSIVFAASFALTRRAEALRTGGLIGALAVIAAAGILRVARAGEVADSVHESARFAAQLIAPPKSVDEAFFRFLAANTNLPHSLRVHPVSIDLAPSLVPGAGPKPHIFFIVVDSLRRDYLAPYNPAVTFTPAIAAFAKDSLVFTNAFTRYGGTGLSEPSLWSGSMLLHKQYVLPFAPMNALEKLIRAEGYTAHISRDTILTALLSPARPGLDADLDSSTQNMDYDLGRSLRELTGKLQNRGERPVFAYTQPQNLHISVMQRQGSSVPDGERYSARFHPPYAARVRTIDSAFGAFVAELRRLGIYEDSIVILTSDHGDSLGEGGRWGHAYTIYPEVIRIPLLIHLPDRLRGTWQGDPHALAFSADITPTLYSLLGHRPQQANGEYGVSLAEPPGKRTGPQLVVSSYGAVYGAVSPDGQRLYIADAVNYAEYGFDLTADPPRPYTPDTADAESARAFIRKSVESISATYGLR